MGNRQHEKRRSTTLVAAWLAFIVTLPGYPAAAQTSVGVAPRARLASLAPVGEQPRERLPDPERLPRIMPPVQRAACEAMQRWGFEIPYDCQHPRPRDPTQVVIPDEPE